MKKRRRKYWQEKQVPEVLQAFLQEIECFRELYSGGIKKAIKAVQKETGHKGKKSIYANSCSCNWTNTWPRLTKSH